MRINLIQYRLEINPNPAYRSLLNWRMRFWVLHAVPPALFLVMLGLLFEYSDIDILIANHFFDFRNNHWLAGDSWWVNDLLHERGRDLIALIFIVAGLTWLASFIHMYLRPYRKTSGYIALTILLTTTLVGAGKKFSNVDCPWDLNLYNGNRPYVHIFSDKPDNLEQGHCFPGGHSSGGFSLMLLYFLFRDKRRRHAWIGLGTGILIGSVYAYAQWARGAHFVSHDVYSAFIAWFVALGVYAGVFKRKL